MLELTPWQRDKIYWVKSEATRIYIAESILITILNPILILLLHLLPAKVYPDTQDVHMSA